jgi:hypothetical protein
MRGPVKFEGILIQGFGDSLSLSPPPTLISLSHAFPGSGLVPFSRLDLARC